MKVSCTKQQGISADGSLCVRMPSRAGMPQPSKTMCHSCRKAYITVDKDKAFLS